MRGGFLSLSLSHWGAGPDYFGIYILEGFTHDDLISIY